MTEAEQMNPDLTETDNLLAAEDFNLRQARRLLAGSFSLVEDVVDLYDTLAALNRESGVSMDDTFPTTQFLLESRVRLVRAGVEACRGYLAESFWHSRRAIELCAFANHIQKRPDAGETWMRATPDDEASYKRFRDEFSRRRILPRETQDQDLRALGERYDLCSKQIHASLLSMARRTRMEDGENSRTVKVSYMELDRDRDPTEPFRSFFWIVWTHLTTVRIFARLMAKAVDFDRSRWEVRYNSVHARLLAHSEEWHARSWLPKPPTLITFG